MTTSAPQDIRHCPLMLHSSVLIFVWRWVASSGGIISFILKSHNASSNIVVISFSLGSSPSKWATFCSNSIYQVQVFIVDVLIVSILELCWMYHRYNSITPNFKDKSFHGVWHAAHDQKLHSICSGKCICFTRSRFSMISLRVSHLPYLPIVSTIIVQLNSWLG